MEAIEHAKNRGSEMGDLISFLWQNKMWFLIPFVVILLFFSAIIFFASATGVAPFIYTFI